MKQGQLAILGILLFVLAFIFAIVVTSPIKDLTDLSRDVNHLDCDNTSISTGTSLACIGVDLTLPGFVLAVIAVGLGMVAKGFNRLR